MKRFISLFLVLTFVFSLSACSCNIDWSNFDLTKRNFGLTEEESTAASESDIAADTAAPSATAAYSDDIINYTVPENSNVVYNEWAVASAEDFDGMAKDRLLEIAELMSELTAMKASLSEYPTVNRIADDESFSRALNNIRAWCYGAKNYPSEGLSDSQLEILSALVTVGTDLSEYGAKLPALLITDNSDSIGDYENLIISQIVVLDSVISE